MSLLHVGKREILDKMIMRMRKWLLQRLGMGASGAQDGRWWEVDLLLVLLLGCVTLGILAWFGL